MSGKSILVSILVLVLGAATLAGEKHRVPVESAVDQEVAGAGVIRSDGIEAKKYSNDMRRDSSRTERK